MKEFPRIRGLSDLRTVTTHHIPSKPPRKGTTYLDLFAFNMEKQRLEQELAGIERQRKRILERLTNSQEAMGKLLSAAHRERVEQEPSSSPGAAHPLELRKQPMSGRWQKMTLNY